MIQNQSRLSELEKCPRKYAWRFLLGLEPKIYSVALAKGTWVHAGLAAWYTSSDINVALAAYDNAFKAAPLDRLDPEVDSVFVTWRARLQEYCRRQKDLGVTVLLVPEQELGLTVGRHKLFTRLDLLIQQQDTNQIWIMDHKTAERTGPSWFAQFYIDKQGTSYILAAQEALGKEPVGWIINVLKGTKDNWFERQAFTRNRDQLDSFLVQTEIQLDKLEEAVVDYPGEEDQKKLSRYLDRNFPQYTHECHGFGTCPFLAICQTGLKAAKPLFKKREPDYVDGASLKTAAPKEEPGR